MDKPGKQWRFNADSVPALVKKYMARVSSYQDYVFFHGRRIRGGTVINALICQWMALPEDQQEAFLVGGLRKYEKLTSGAGASTPEERRPATHG